jgi:hypothetical protein
MADSHEYERVATAFDALDAVRSGARKPQDEPRWRSATVCNPAADTLRDLYVEARAAEYAGVSVRHFEGWIQATLLLAHDEARGEGEGEQSPVVAEKRHAEEMAEVVRSELGLLVGAKTKSANKTT